MDSSRLENGAERGKGEKKLSPEQEAKGQVTEHLDMLMEHIKGRGGARCWFLCSQQPQLMPGKLLQALAPAQGASQ